MRGLEWDTNIDWCRECLEMSNKRSCFLDNCMHIIRDWELDGNDLLMEAIAMNVGQIFKYNEGELQRPKQRTILCKILRYLWPKLRHINDQSQIDRMVHWMVVRSNIGYEIKTKCTIKKKLAWACNKAQFRLPFWQYIQYHQQIYTPDTRFFGLICLLKRFVY